MKPEVPFNPFSDSENFTKKDPKDMSLSELEILLYSKRVTIKLEAERLYKKINASKIILDVINSLGIPEKIESFISGTSPQSVKTESETVKEKT
ncbi:MAG TPA: hypothetical protein PK453_11010 [Leptospiraceae bacterium]|nr:hypothetical protein [Leptospiraceae bacterium]HMY65715.1 hypothetical protein [Leptospiraceae bacterium]HNF14192.1 hypothetical protein [Leptospiraceae bacterium]HNI96291.1 hypothetical protein [Leptospiraceae bacterium]HNM04560.1 hypothetical protein [Leptospiraceae bacterium]